MSLHVLEQPKRSALYTGALVAGVLVLAVAVLLLPLIAAAQPLPVAALTPDDIQIVAKLFLDAVRGGDWMVAVLAGLVALVWLVRKVLVRIPKVAAFVATDAGGAIVNLCTLVPVGLLGAHLAGQPMTWQLALAVVGGPTALYVMARKIVVPLARKAAPLVYRIPYVGPALAALLDPAWKAPATRTEG